MVIIHQNKTYSGAEDDGISVVKTQILSLRMLFGRHGWLSWHSQIYSLFKWNNHQGIKKPQHVHQILNILNVGTTKVAPPPLVTTPALATECFIKPSTKYYMTNSFISGRSRVQNSLSFIKFTQWYVMLCSLICVCPSTHAVLSGFIQHIGGNMETNYLFHFIGLASSVFLCITSRTTMMTLFKKKMNGLF